MRLFIAAHISDDLKRHLSRFLEKSLRELKSCKKVKWVKTGNVHLTLKFMGEVDESRLDGLIEALNISVEAQEKFVAQVKGIGVFPDIHRPRVLWAGIEDPGKRLEKLAASVEKETVSAGFTFSDKPFAAHLTLARFESSAPGLAEYFEKNKEISFGEILVDKVALVQSQLTPSGPIYTDLKEFFLRAD